MNLIDRIMGRNPRKAWQQFSQELGADFIPGKGFRKSDVIRAFYQNWIILIDTYKKRKKPTYTRIRAPYTNRDSFQFSLFREGAFSGMRKAMGMQDVIVGHPQFDKRFVIQGNDDRKLKALFDNQFIRRAVSWQPDIYLENEVDDGWMTDHWREGSSMLNFRVKGVIRDAQQLHDLYDLFAELLEHLCEIGSAYRDKPLNP